MARFTIWAATNKLGSRAESSFDIDDDELGDLTEQERDALIDEYAREHLWQLIEWSWERADA